MTALLWYRRDLRVADHPALHAALEDGLVVPAFCFDDRLLRGRHASGPRTQFLLECLRDLDQSLRERGSGLVIRHGRPERELPRLAREVGATAIHATADTGPFAAQRDARVAGLVLHAGLGAVDEPLLTKARKPYTVFTPFHRAWLAATRREVLPAPRRLPPLPAKVRKGRLPSLAALGLEQEVAEPLPGGEGRGRERMARFLANGVRRYDDGHDVLDGEGTSRLSAYLHFGCISARELEQRLPRGAGADAFRRQLCWRDFFHDVLHHFPANARSEFQERYRGGRLRWSYARRRFERWCTGQTGFPLVDAGMRQLLREGWMHNRARLVVGSFLTKDLGIDWRWGERHFMRLLIDGDEANNNGNWQWIASVGVDPAPAFRRIFNPALHMERFDPHGGYVRRYVPELRAVPDRYLREPWTMPAALQRDVGCVIGSDYPAPIVDHAQARREALARYRGA
jgi:deoxyribodipyrimidine photo-lyase